MRNSTRTSPFALLALASLLAVAGSAGSDMRPAQLPAANAAAGATQYVYLPLIMTQTSSRRVNVPYFDVANIGQSKFSETAIFWFGRIGASDNYADVRLGYNNAELYVYVAAFDRRLWYDTSPAPGDLTNWDAVTLYLDRDGNVGGAPDTDAYRFDAQFNWWEARTNYQAAYKGNGSAWATANLPLTTGAGWKGDAPNNNTDDRGWAMTFRVPFTSLGLSGPPAQGTLWGLALALHDRDDSGGAPISDKTWPESLDANRQSTWGQLRFGLPTYTPPSAASTQVTTIRHKLDGAVVTDAAVGGYSVCGNGLDYWTEWGNANYGGDTDFNIQNQSDISDWPCFSKYYVTFPLSAIPSGKAIVSATLTLHHSGNAGNAGQAQPSLIQVLSVGASWNEATLTWNTAPLATENVGRGWVDPVPPGCGSSVPWPCFARTFDVSYAVAQAYAAQQPLRLALYSADSDYHSGKYFTSSDTGDWNAAGRPTLQVRWGNP
ncbi:MAG TPA: DNRLRE domain-containing protein [Anaerolineae bacterium]|nr:DNRLRE domain-containing protein [Anaerolineae bacterium]